MTDSYKTEAEFWRDFTNLQHSIQLVCGEINCLVTRLPRECVAIHGFAANELDLRAAAQRLALCAPDSCRSIANANTPKVDVTAMKPEDRHEFALAVPSKKKAARKARKR